jgi:hypothetical protein
VPICRPSALCDQGARGRREQEDVVRQAGIYCLIFGAGSFVLPMLGLQFKLLSLFGSATPLVGLGLVALGGVLFVVGQKQTAS